MEKNRLIELIIMTIALHYDVDQNVVLKGKKDTDTRECRDAIVYFLRIEMGLTFNEIGEIVNLDRSATGRAYKRALERNINDKCFQVDVKRIKEKIKGYIRNSA